MLGIPAAAGCRSKTVCSSRGAACCSRRAAQPLLTRVARLVAQPPLVTGWLLPNLPRAAQDRMCRPMAATASPDGPDGSGLDAEFARLMRERATSSSSEEADAGFDGAELARLVRAKFEGRGYDVHLLRKEWLGQKIFAVNIMWKYREQASFLLSEEEYIAQLDHVASVIKKWKAVKRVRTAIATTKERPRIGKAVSIIIDLPDELSREWAIK